MSLHESGEMYLETILILSKKLDHVRSIDVVEHMGFSKPSVSRGMKLLREQKMIEMDGAGYITLTDAGREIAEKIYERHTFLSEFIAKLGVDPQIAEHVQPGLIIEILVPAVQTAAPSDRLLQYGAQPPVAPGQHRLQPGQIRRVPVVLHAL